jgi:hypothetical protein
MDARILTPSGRDLVQLPAGLTVAEVVERAVPEAELRETVIVFCNGLIVKDWNGVRVREGESLLLCAVPQGRGGGKQILGTILTIVVAIVAWYVAPVLVGAQAGTMAALSGMQAAAAYGIAAGITMLGTMAINAMIPPPSISSGLNSNSSAADNSYFITGQSNQARPYGAVLRVYGRYKVFPVLASNPIITNIGRSSRFQAIYDFGIGGLNFESGFRVGDVDLYEYGPDVRVHQGTTLPNGPELVTRQAGYDQYQISLQQGEPTVIRSKPNAVAIEATLTFPRGLYTIDTQGNIQTQHAYFKFEVRDVNSSTWYQLSVPNIAGAPGVQIYGVIGNRIEVRLNPAYGGNGEWRAYDPGTTPQWLYSVGARPNGTHDAQNPEPGGDWIIEWRDPYGAFEPVRYQQRYPGSAPPNWQSSVWAYFTQVGAYYGHDPYLWLDWYIDIYGNQVAPFSVAISQNFGYQGTFEMRLTRTSPVATDTRTADDAVLTMLKSFIPGPVLKLSNAHTMIEISVEASEQLSGVIQTLNAIVWSDLRMTTDGVNFTSGNTRNPVWIALDVLTGAANPRPLDVWQIDWPSWLRLATICDTPRTWNVNGVSVTMPRFTCDIVVDGATTVKTLVDSILTTCRASLMMTTSGKYGVLIDEEQSVPKQVITPLNSWNFGGTRQFMDYPHALRVTFIDPDNNWQKSQILCYADGYNESNATRFEDLDTYGITDYPHAWAYGRYMLAQGILRSETFSVTMDVENLACQRGDLVYVAHDVPNVGGYPARVVSANASTGQVVVAAALSVAPTGYLVRLSDGTTRSGTVTYVPPDLPNTFLIDNAAGIQPDDLMVLGKISRVTQPYLVTRITPAADLTAELTLCKYDPGVYTADIGALPPWTPGFGDDMIGATDLVTSNVQITQRIVYRDRRPYIVFTATWQTVGSYLDHHRLVVKYGDGEVVVLPETAFLTATWELDALANPRKWDIPLALTVTPIGPSGLIGVAGLGYINPAPDRTPPATPQDFAVNVQDMTVQCFWRTPDEEDIDYFLIRYTPETLQPAWNASQVVAKISWNTTHMVTGARTGTYMIRAYDTSGNESGIAYQRTTIAELPNINAVETVNDAEESPAWNGQHVNTQTYGASMGMTGAMGQIPPEGTYYCEELVDLGQVYEARISSKIRAHGDTQDDYMSSWPTLSQVPYLARARADQWDAWVEVRCAQAMTFIAAWPTMAEIDPIAEVDDSEWSDWRPVHVGDFTGRLFQFRIQLRSYSPDVRPVVSDGLIEIDMPDRIDSVYDVSIPVAGADIVYDPSFRNVPAVAVSIDGSVDPLIANVTARSRQGFHVQLINAIDGAPEAGRIDWISRGYGRERPAPI